ncbi:hypothetical protein CVT24_009365 [Panaeolus cyanescens]|uniref:Uncharacterized protein n=1 Tax=Panaeolus cyanescens TaxID=181874 RepID=A0A409Y7Z9_9AGAR|nr:hypothetical protein CVT24_009365 [Panaeolus cyanescens]
MTTIISTNNNHNRSNIKPPTNLRERIAAIEQKAAGNVPSSRATSPTPSNASNSSSFQPAPALKDKIAKFERKGGVPVPRGSFGLGAPPSTDAPRRQGELYGNRIPPPSRVVSSSATFNRFSRAASPGPSSAFHSPNGSPTYLPSEKRRSVSLSSPIGDTDSQSNYSPISSPSVPPLLDSPSDAVTRPLSPEGLPSPDSDYSSFKPKIARGTSFQQALEIARKAESAKQNGSVSPLNPPGQEGDGTPETESPIQESPQQEEDDDDDIYATTPAQSSASAFSDSFSNEVPNSATEAVVQRAQSVITINEPTALGTSEATTLSAPDVAQVDEAQHQYRTPPAIYIPPVDNDEESAGTDTASSTTWSPAMPVQPSAAVEEPRRRSTLEPPSAHTHGGFRPNSEMVSAALEAGSLSPLPSPIFYPVMSPDTAASVAAKAEHMNVDITPLTIRKRMQDMSIAEESLSPSFYSPESPSTNASPAGHDGTILSPALSEGSLQQSPTPPEIVVHNPVDKQEPTIPAPTRNKPADLDENLINQRPLSSPPLSTNSASDDLFTDVLTNYFTGKVDGQFPLSTPHKAGTSNLPEPPMSPPATLAYDEEPEVPRQHPPPPQVIQIPEAPQQQRSLAALAGAIQAHHPKQPPSLTGLAEAIQTQQAPAANPVPQFETPQRRPTLRAHAEAILQGPAPINPPDPANFLSPPATAGILSGSSMGSSLGSLGSRPMSMIETSPGRIAQALRMTPATGRGIPMFVPPTSQARPRKSDYYHFPPTPDKEQEHEENGGEENAVEQPAEQEEEQQQPQEPQEVEVVISQEDPNAALKRRGSEPDLTSAAATAASVKQQPYMSSFKAVVHRKVRETPVVKSATIGHTGRTRLIPETPQMKKVKRATILEPPLSPGQGELVMLLQEAVLLEDTLSKGELPSEPPVPYDQQAENQRKVDEVAKLRAEAKVREEEKKKLEAAKQALQAKRDEPMSGRLKHTFLVPLSKAKSVMSRKEGPDDAAVPPLTPGGRRSTEQQQAQPRKSHETHFPLPRKSLESLRSKKSMESIKPRKSHDIPPPPKSAGIHAKENSVYRGDIPPTPQLPISAHPSRSQTTLALPEQTPRSKTPDSAGLPPEVPPKSPKSAGRFASFKRLGSISRSIQGSSSSGRYSNSTSSEMSSEDSAPVAVTPPDGMNEFGMSDHHGHGMNFPSLSPKKSGGSIGRATSFAEKMWSRSRTKSSGSTLSAASVDSSGSRVPSIGPPPPFELPPLPGMTSSSNASIKSKSSSSKMSTKSDDTSRMVSRPPARSTSLKHPMGLPPIPDSGSLIPPLPTITATSFDDTFSSDILDISRESHDLSRDSMLGLPSDNKRPSSWTSMSSAGSLPSPLFDNALFDAFPSVPGNVPEPVSAYEQAHRREFGAPSAGPATSSFDSAFLSSAIHIAASQAVATPNTSTATHISRPSVSSSSYSQSSRRSGETIR